MPVQGRSAPNRSPPLLASGGLSPASLRGSGSEIRTPGLRWRPVTRETRRAACGCRGNPARAEARGARLRELGAGPAPRAEWRLESPTPVAGGEGRRRCRQGCDVFLFN